MYNIPLELIAMSKGALNVAWVAGPPVPHTKLHTTKLAHPVKKTQANTGVTNTHTHTGSHVRAHTRAWDQRVGRETSTPIPRHVGDTARTIAREGGGPVPGNKSQRLVHLHFEHLKEGGVHQVQVIRGVKRKAGAGL